MITHSNKCFVAVSSVIVSLGLLTGCDPMYRMTKCPSYVVCYADLSSLVLETESTNPRCIVLDAAMDFSKSFGLHSTDAAKERYDQLCQKHNDLSYNQYRSIGGTLDIESVTYIDCDFSEIMVTADKDFDAEHPAGTNLSDIVRFMSWSPYRYIQSGYSKYYHYDKSDVSEAFDTQMRLYINKEYFDNTTDATCYPIDKLIKDLTSEDLILLGHDAPFFLGLLYFDKTPDMNEAYIFTVTIKTDDDKILSKTVERIF